MLCPNCGKDVGDKPRLCDDCEKASRPAEDPAADSPGGAPESGEPPAPENLPAVNRKQQKKAKPPPESRTADNSNNLPKIIAFAVVLLGVCGYFVFRSGGSSQGPDTAATGSSGTTSPPASSPAATAAPAATPASASATAAPTAGASTNTEAPAAEVSLTNAQWKDSFAVFDRQKNDLTFAMFTEMLSNEDKAAAVTNGAIPQKMPRFVLTVSLEPGSTIFTSSAAKSIKAAYTGKEVGAGGVSLSYVIGKKEMPAASALSGNIEAGAILSFASKQNAEKTLDSGKKVKISWDLTVKTPLIAVLEKTARQEPTPDAAPVETQSSTEVSQSASGGTDATEVPDGTQTPGNEPSVPNVAEGELGNISSDNTAMSIKEAYALYYPETGAVSIGFFGQELDDADRAEIQRKKIVTTFVNGKRPSLVLGLDFSKKNGEASRQNLLGYSAYFYRDTSGLFFFPGSFDSRSIRRNVKELQPYEFTVLSGHLKDGATIAIRTAGDNKPPEGQTKLGWNLAIKVVLHAVN